jgi:hypothetical protein
MTTFRPSNIRHGRTNERGAVLIMLLLALPLLTGVVLYSYRMAVLTRERARLQDLADVAALQAAAIQARGLNALALLNDLLLGLEGLAAGVTVNGHGLALGLDALLVTAPEGIELHKVSSETFQQLRNLSHQVGGLQDFAVTVLAVAPAAGAQLPLLFESFAPQPVLLAYPLPGLEVGLRSTPPVSSRGHAFDNLLDAATGELLRAADGLFDPLNKELRAIAKHECAAVKKGKKLLGLLPGKSKKKAKAAGNLDADDVAAACEALREFAKKKGGIVQQRLAALLAPGAGGSGGGGTPQAGSGFVQPLLLDAGYGEDYQVAVLAMRCAPYADCPSVSPADQMYALAQARAASRYQPEGGDLYLPDFRATLVPVSIFSRISNLKPQPSNLAPWSVQH